MTLVWLKDFGDVRAFDSYSCVTHVEDEHLRGVIKCHAHPDTASHRELDRVLDEVDEHLL